MSNAFKTPVASRIAVVAALAGFTASSGMLGVAVYTCAAEEQVHLDRCCEEEESTAEYPAITSLDRCCEVHDVAIHSDHFTTDRSRSPATQPAALAQADLPLVPTSGAIASKRYARGPPGTAPPIHLQACALLI